MKFAGNFSNIVIERNFLICIWMPILGFGILLFNCGGFDINSSQELFNAVFAEGGKKNPKIIFQKEVNLTPSNLKEIVYVIRNGNEEILVVLDNSKKIVFKKIFTLLNIGPIEYDSAKKKWIPSSAKVDSNSLYIIKNLRFQKITNDSYDSIFLEILSEEPPLELFSIPLVYGNFELVFDGFSLFKETMLLKELNRIPLTYIPEKNGIHVFSAQPAFDKFYNLNK